MKTSQVRTRSGVKYNIEGFASLGALGGYVFSTKVRDVQTKLIQLGYDLGAGKADGLLGPKTAAAIKKFRSDNKLPACTTSDCIDSFFEVQLNALIISKTASGTLPPSSIALPAKSTSSYATSSYTTPSSSASKSSVPMVTTPGEVFNLKSPILIGGVAFVGLGVVLLVLSSGGESSGTKRRRPTRRKLQANRSRRRGRR